MNTEPFYLQSLLKNSTFFAYPLKRNKLVVQKEKKTKAEFPLYTESPDSP